MLAVLMEVPRSLDAWDRWLFHHRENHADIRQGVQTIVASVTVTSAGSGFKDGTYDLAFSGTGTGAAGTYTTSGGSVTAIAVTAPGRGYSAAPTVSFPSGGGTGAAATASLGPNLVEYTLDPVPVQNEQQWLAWNQQTHNDMNGALSLQSVDLQSLNLKDDKSLEQWIWDHYREHLAANQSLGI